MAFPTTWDTLYPIVTDHTVYSYLRQAGLSCILAVATFGITHAQSSGTLDVAFGTNGVCTISIPSAYTLRNSKPVMVEGPDGATFVAALANHATSGQNLMITRVTASGVVDTTFGINGFAANVLGIASGVDNVLCGMVRLASSGRLIVGFKQSLQSQIRAFTETGGVDSAFGSSGSLTFSGVTLNGLWGVNSVSVFGSREVAGSGKEAWELRVSSVGVAIQNAWLPTINGPGDQEITCTGVLPNGVSVVVGHSIRPDGQRSVFVAQKFSQFQRIFASDVHFGPSGNTSIPIPGSDPVIPKAFSFDGFGEYVLHCEQGEPGTAAARGVAIRLLRTAAVDTQFAGNTILAMPFFEAGTNGETVEGGVSDGRSRHVLLQTVKEGAGLSKIGLSQFFWDGSLHSEFGDNGRASIAFSTNAHAHEVINVAGDKMLILGSLRSGLTPTNVVLARLHRGAAPVNPSLAITASPQATEIGVGETAELTLQAEGVPAAFPLRYQLKKDGVRVGGTSLSPTFTLAFNPATAGNYTIEVSNGVSTTESGPALVYMIQPPVWTNVGPLEQTVLAGTSFEFAPAVSGRFPMSYVWRRLGGATLREGSITRSGSSTSWQNPIRFSPVRLSDNGEYELLLSNADGESSVLSIDLTVLKDPSFTSRSKSILLEKGDQGQGIWAVATASTPTITYKGTKNGRPIKLFMGEPGVNLHEATLADAGTYRFTAHTVKGMATSEQIEVAVVDPTPGNRVVKSNGTAVLDGVSAGKGLVYAWFKDGVALEESTKLQGTKKKRLVVRQVTEEDVGVYVCEVTAHETTKRAAELTVHLVSDKPVLNLSSLPSARVATHYSAQLSSVPLAASFSVSGLPKGLTLDRVTGKISGVTRTSGTYRVTITSINPLGRTVSRLPLQVEALPFGVAGRFVGVGSFHESGDPPALQTGLLNVRVSPSGTVSGSVTLSKLRGKRQSIPFRAILTKADSSGASFESNEIPFKPQAATGFNSGTLQIGVDETTREAGVVISMSSPIDYLSQAVVGDHVPWDSRKQPVTSLVGNYNLESNSQEDSTIAPAGYNFARITVLPSGAVIVTGLLSDDTPLIASTWLTGAQKVPIHAWLYGNKGYYRTELAFTPGTNTDFRDNRVSGESKWFKSASLNRTDTSYLDGFSVAPNWSGSKYLQPRSVGTGPLMMNMEPGENNLAGHYILSPEGRYTRVTLTSKHQARSVDPGSDYDDRVVDLRFSAKSGLFSGTWIKNVWVETEGVPVRQSTRFPMKGLVVRPHDSLQGRAVGFAKVPIQVTETDSRGRPRVRNLFVPASVAFYD